MKLYRRGRIITRIVYLVVVVIVVVVDSLENKHGTTFKIPYKFLSLYFYITGSVTMYIIQSSKLLITRMPCLTVILLIN